MPRAWAARSSLSLLPDSDERGAHVAAERMRRAIREGFADDSMPLTISFGIASFPAHGDNTDDLMESADQALYTAKEIGRDCSVIFSPQAADNVSGHARRRHARGEARLASLLTLAESLDAHEHAATVGRYAREIGRQLGYPQEELENLMLAGILHDVGKVGIPSSIVLKPGPLDHGRVGRDEKAPGDRGQHARGRQPAADRRMGALSPRAARRPRLPARASRATRCHWRRASWRWPMPTRP